MLMRSVPTLRHISSLAHTMRLSAHFAYFSRKVLHCVDHVNLDGLLHTFFYSDAAGELNTDNNYCICPAPVRCTIDEKINMTWLEVRHSRPSRFDGHSPQKERKKCKIETKILIFHFLQYLTEPSNLLASVSSSSSFARSSFYFAVSLIEFFSIDNGTNSIDTKPKRYINLNDHPR